LIIVLWFLYQLVSGLWTIWKLKKMESGLEAEISRLRALEIYYSKQKELYNDPEWIEFVARERLGMVRPGDRLIRLLPE